MADTFGSDVTILGSLYVRGALPAITRSDLTLETYAQFPVDMTSLRVWNAFETPISTPTSDDLGFSAGAFGTGTPYVSAGACGGGGILTTTTRYARFLYTVPLEYVAGQLAQFSFLAGITGGTPAAASGGSAECTLDMSVYKVGTDGAVSGSDLVTTSATSMNSTSFAIIAMELNVTSLNPSDVLDCRIVISCTDTPATSTNVVPAITKLFFNGGARG